MHPCHAFLPLQGMAVQKLVGEVSDLSPALLDKVRAAYAMKK
jgi:hypothetical protein